MRGADWRHPRGPESSIQGLEQHPVVHVTFADAWQSNPRDGYEGTSPVAVFPANGYGLYDLIGNVWEWTTDWYTPKHPAEVVKACCIPRNPRGPRAEDSFDPRKPEIRIPRKVLKGGSHLCAPNYCRRYRPAARYPEPIDTSTCHVGFRCIARPPAAG